MAPNGRRLQDRIIDLILARGLAPGAPMPAEPRLVDELGASRNSVREALRALHTLGIIEIRHGHGTFVGQAPLTAFTPGLLYSTRQSVRSGASALRDMLEIRRTLEASLIEQVVERADEDFLAELDAAASAIDAGELSAADQHFHEVLYRRVPNRLAVELIELFWTVYHQVESDLEPPGDDPGEIGRAHRVIADAVRAGDAVRAREALVRHFGDIEQRVARLDARA
ncbi:FadR/GntR family transcriptional regulator [Allonocardiopsis opalescens]|uniref:GntR family transcriptional regulator n=1 Tax=Allonocardiopsis opalescens TaxID=1144618 RepID=A0A2T0PZN5_9ACTN|nr:FCD domain-containing protein [Allonocardiopsis opalescens]PRX96994.1 GntR family transcriptional regulator [Allonocardiopsis opalescens]